MKGLFSGRQIKDLKGRSQAITRSQTAAQAYAAIMGKYGEIKDNAHYFHKGKGEWHKYSLESDRTRTGKLAATKSEWAERPNKFDWTGIDTKAERKPAGKKYNFSMSKLSPIAPVGRQTKARLKASGKPVLKSMEKPKVVVPKEPFQMTFKEYFALHPTKMVNTRIMEHTTAVQRAIILGDKPPKKVLDEYDIRMEYGKVRNIKLKPQYEEEVRATLSTLKK